MADRNRNGCYDVHIQVVSRRFVKASNISTAPHVLAVSNLDLLYSNFPVSFLCVYRRPPAGGDFNAVVASFEAALPSFLNHFFPFAGRIVTHPSSRLPEIHCNNEGAELVVGHADTVLSGLDYFSRVGSSLFKVRLPYDDDIIPLSVQLVSFACGGFSVSWCTSHLMVDGCAITMLIRMWSEFLQTGTLAGPVPSHDRSVLRPHSPPSYRLSYGDAYTPDRPEHLVNVLATQCFIERLYYIEAGDVDRLRRAASREDGRRRATRMEAVSAYLWKVLAAVVGSGDERCRMGWWVDGRRCLSMPRGYMGNVTSFAVREAGVEEILRAAAPDVAALVREAVAATASEEHFRELVDWLEDHKAQRYLEAATIGLGSPTLTVSWLATFRLDTDFGFGKAALAMPMELSETRQCSGYMVVAENPGGDRSLFVSAFVWPRLAAALESDDHHVFKPVTAEYSFRSKM